MSDQSMARIARDLAQALSDFAYSRSDEDKKRVSESQFGLCKAWRDEQTEKESKT